MAATPAQHSTQKVQTHQVQKQHKSSHMQKSHAPAQKTTAKKVEDKTPTAK